MSTTNKFCPDCSTLLHPVERNLNLGETKDIDDDQEEEGLYLVCGDCAYSEKAVTFSSTHFSKKVEITPYIHPKRMVNDYLYDMTFSRTKKKQCSNSKCPSRGNDNPEIVLITSENHPEIAYLCSECKHIWGKV